MESESACSPDSGDSEPRRSLSRCCQSRLHVSLCQSLTDAAHLKSLENYRWGCRGRGRGGRGGRRGPGRGIPHWQYLPSFQTRAGLKFTAFLARLLRRLRVSAVQVQANARPRAAGGISKLLRLPRPGPLRVGRRRRDRRRDLRHGGSSRPGSVVVGALLN